MAILEKVRSPEDLKGLSLKELEQLAQELRQKVIEVTSKNGGHVAPNLGVVELTIALHYVYESPKDKIIWDVGHQAYIHKMLTGRLDRIHTLRTLGGLSGFTKRDESEHDPFGAGHASTALSAALGFAVARDLKGEDYHVVAVVGDGALTGGMAMEALNHGGHLQKRITVILNDNERSIAENVGGISNYLAKLSTNRLYNRIKQDINELLKHIPDNLLTRKAKTVAWKVKESLKNLMVPTILFEELGYRYIGPVNGHDLEQLIDILMQVRDFVREPVVVHVITKKGKGYEPAERNPELFHGLGPYDPKTGEPIKKPGPPSYSSVAGKTILEIAEKDERVVAITAAMALGTGLVPFRERFPDRLFDVGIAEQHATTFAAGMAFGGLKPFAAIYSTFLQRAYDQLIHDVALQRAPVRFCLDRAGLVGDDGPTHHGVFDLIYLRTIPNFVVMAPKDEDELRDMLYTMWQHEAGPIAVRYPRGRAVGVPFKPEPQVIPIGKWETLREGKDAVLLAVGATVYPALKAAQRLEAEGFSVGVINARFVKPLDQELLLELLEGGPRAWITLEEGNLPGGFGSAVMEFLEERRASEKVRLFRHGIPDKFIEHGSRAELLRLVKLDEEGIYQVVKGFLEAL